MKHLPSSQKGVSVIKSNHCYFSITYAFFCQETWNHLKQEKEDASTMAEAGHEEEKEEQNEEEEEGQQQFCGRHSGKMWGRRWGCFMEQQGYRGDPGEGKAGLWCGGEMGHPAGHPTVLPDKRQCWNLSSMPDHFSIQKGKQRLKGIPDGVWSIWVCTFVSIKHFHVF